MKNKIKIIPNTNNQYGATINGEIFSFKRSIFLLKQKEKNGRFAVYLSINGKVKKYRVHRLIGLTFIDNPLNKPQINHLDGNKLNNKVSNLEWVTDSENKFHAYQNGLKKVNPQAILNMKKCAIKKRKLNFDDIQNILKIKKQKTQKEIACLYNVTQSVISEILNKKIYKEFVYEPK